MDALLGRREPALTNKFTHLRARWYRSSLCNETTVTMKVAAIVVLLIAACDWLPPVPVAPNTGGHQYALETRALACGDMHRTSRTRSDVADAWSCLPGVDASGTEVLFTFDSPITGDVVVSVTDHSWYPLVTVSPRAPTLDPSRCIAGNYYSVRFSAVAGRSYTVAVDSDGSHGDITFDISIVCDAPATEGLSCENGVDDDGDFALDCQDEDCFELCGITGTCTAAATAACGETRFAEATDSADSTDAFANYGCQAVNDLVAPERIYSFSAVDEGDVLVTLSDYTAYPVVTILEDSGAGCHPGDCLMQNFYGARFHAIAGRTYYAVVESWTDQSFTYDLTWICDPPDTENGFCDDNIDNDGDLLWDCEDEDCWTDSSCPVGGPCVSTRVVECDSVTAGDTAGIGATDQVSLYGCDPEWPLAGNEVAYRFIPPRRTNVRVSATDFSDYPVLAVLEGDSCDASSCLDMNYYSVEFEARPGRTYYFVVESGGIGPFSYNLNVVCGSRADPGCPLCAP